MALRARGLLRTSSSVGTIGFLVNTLTTSLCCEGAERVLDDAVLERVKRDDDEPRALPQAPRRGLEKSIQPFELAVDPDSQRLKRARRRIDAHARRSAPRNRAAHNRREPPRRLDGRLASRVDDGPGDPPREALLAELKDRVGQLLFARSRDQVGGRVAGAPVHPHVERFVALEAESAARLVELHRGDAEVGERAVDERHPEAVEHGVERAVVGVNQRHALVPRRQRARARAPARRGRDRGR